MGGGGAANASPNVGTGGGGELGDVRSLPLLKRRMNPLFFFATCLVGPAIGESPPGSGIGGAYRWGDSNVLLPFAPALLDRVRPWPRIDSVSTSATMCLDDAAYGLEMIVGCAVTLRARACACASSSDMSLSAPPPPTFSPHVERPPIGTPGREFSRVRGATGLAVDPIPAPGVTGEC